MGQQELERDGTMKTMCYEVESLTAPTSNDIVVVVANNDDWARADLGPH